MPRQNVIERIEALSVDLFDAIPSQTSESTRRSLLSVQRATARRHPQFAYLEIGSHLGGSIAPYLLDPRCLAITSIDSRPAWQPDDRALGKIATYENNSTQHMMERLRTLDAVQASKVRCFETDASQVDPSLVTPRPHIAFIDAEHTRKAVRSDFDFCRKVLADDGTIVFDDFSIVYPAVLEICRSLKREGRPFLPVRLEGRVFAIFFDQDTVRSDPFLGRCRARSRFTLTRYSLKLWFKSFLPGPAGKLARSIRRHQG
jgi:hypothetical protein